MPVISVIIPTYNMEKNISITIESIVNQTTDMSIEVIIIDDGSTDNSYEIAQEYMEKYKDIIRVYKKENGGLSDARNYGVRKAKGEYILFVDAGDYLNLFLFENIKKYIVKEIQVIKFKMVKVDENNKEILKIDGPCFELKNGQEALKALIGKDFFFEVACIYLYKKDFWHDNKFRYEKGMYHEDFGLTPWILLNANTVTSVNEFGYYYVQHNNSITRNSDYNKTIKKAKDLLFHYDNIVNLLQNGKYEKSITELVKSYYTNVVILKINELKKIEQKQYIKEIKKRKMLKNIKVNNFKQFIKKLFLRINIKLYLKIR